MTSLTLSEVHKMVHSIDPNLEVDSPQFATGVLLASFLAVGPNVKRLHKFCKLPMEFVSERIGRLKANGIVTDDGTFIVNWDDEATGGIAFLMDCQVADGLMDRDESGNYGLTAAGKERAERLMRRKDQ